jgi:hypothetical protein
MKHTAGLDNVRSRDQLNIAKLYRDAAVEDETGFPAEADNIPPAGWVILQWTAKPSLNVAWNNRPRAMV